MVKIHTTLSIDDGVIKEAKEKFFNMSEIAENAIKEKLGQVEVIIEEAKNCEFCSTNDLNGLTWLYPDEKWICPSCLTSKSRKCLN